MAADEEVIDSSTPDAIERTIVWLRLKHGDLYRTWVRAPHTLSTEERQFVTRHLGMVVTNDRWV